MASTVKVVLGSIAFGIFWVMAVFPSVPCLPVGRTAGSLLGAMLMVVFRVLSPDQAYHAIDLPILGLLFGTMVVSIYLERADMFKYLGKLLSWKSRGAKDLLCRICVISAVSSALFTNDTACVVLTEFVLKVARQHNLPPHPFLLALATSSNIGSAATPIGNPQNLVIAVESKISFGQFLVGVLPAMLVGVAINAVMLLAMYWRILTIKKVEEDPAFEVAAVEAVNSHRFSPATLSHFSSMGSQDWSSKLENLNVQNSPSVHSVHSASSATTSNVERLRNRLSSSETEIHRVLSDAIGSGRSFNGPKDVAIEVGPQKREDESGAAVSAGIGVHSNRITSATVALDTLSFRSSEAGRPIICNPKKWKRLVWKTCVYLVTVGMLVALLLGLDMSWTAITAALALIVLDFQDAQQSLEKVI